MVLRYWTYDKDNFDYLAEAVIVHQHNLSDSLRIETSHLDVTNYR